MTKSARLRQIATELAALEENAQLLRSERHQLTRKDSDFVANQDKARGRELKRWQGTLAVLWRKCCEHDGISVDARFVAFSDANPFVPFWKEAMRQYDAFLQGNLGYVEMNLRTWGDSRR